MLPPGTRGGELHALAAPLTQSPAKRNFIPTSTRARFSTTAIFLHVVMIRGARPSISRWRRRTAANSTWARRSISSVRDRGLRPRASVARRRPTAPCLPTRCNTAAFAHTTGNGGTSRWQASRFPTPISIFRCGDVHSPARLRALRAASSLNIRSSSRASFTNTTADNRVFLAQSASHAPPFNTLDAIAGWAAGLGFKGVQRREAKCAAGLVFSCWKRTRGS